MISLVAHVDITDCTDGTTLLMPLTHRDDLTNSWWADHRSQISLNSCKFHPQKPKIHLIWFKYPVNNFLTSLEWHRFLCYIKPLCNMMYCSWIRASTCYKEKNNLHLIHTEKKQHCPSNRKTQKIHVWNKKFWIAAKELNQWINVGIGTKVYYCLAILRRDFSLMS